MRDTARLSGPESQSLKTIVAANVSVVRESFADRDFGDEVCALSLYPTPVEELEPESGDSEGLALGLFSLGLASVETVANRRHTMASAEVSDEFVDAWNGDEYAFAYEPLIENIRTLEFIRAESILAQAVARHNLGQHWVFNYVAIQLTLDPPVGRPSENFIAFSAEEDFGDELLENLWAVVPPAIADRLLADGLLFPLDQASE